MHMDHSGTGHTPSAFPTVEEMFTFQSDLSHQWFDNILFFFADNTQVERNEYEYKADDGTLTLKVSIKLADLVGKDTGSSFVGFDTTLIEGLVADLGATDMSFTKFVVKDDEIVFELVANGINATEAEVAAQLEVLPMGLTIEDADGDTAEIALHMGAENAPIQALAETDLDAMMESYSDYLSAANKAQIEDVLGEYGPTECAAIVDSFHDYDPDRDIPDQLMMTEDVWFGVAPGEGDYALCKDDEELTKMEWDYSRGGDKLTLEVEFKTAGLFGVGADDLVTQIDTSAIEALMADLGATEIIIDKLDIAHDKVAIKIIGEGIDITDKEVYELPGDVSFGLTTQDGEGNLTEGTLDLCVKDYDPHSPVTFDLNMDGKIATTGATTAMDAVGNQLGDTVSFDIDADGKADTMEWLVGDGDGFLIDNRDGNAMNDMDGARLFGDQGGTYVNGYQKLSMEFDGDGDGVLVGDELIGLEFWVDDGDAVAEEGEFISVQDFGVSEIATGYCLDENSRGEFLMKSLAVIEGADLPDPTIDPGVIIDPDPLPEPEPIDQPTPDDGLLDPSFPIPLIPVEDGGYEPEFDEEVLIDDFVFG